MGTNFVPEPLSSGLDTTSSINTNNTNIQTSLGRMLNVFGDVGVGGNALQVNLDMNSNRVINATDAFNASDLVTKRQLDAKAAATLTNVDAVNVDYTPAGGSAVETTVQAKLRERVSVTDLGVLGDGATDDTTAFNAVLAVGGDIYVPKGTGDYVISDQLIFVSDTTITFEAGAGIVILNAGDAINNTGKAVLELDELDNVTIYGNGLTITGVRTGTGIANVNRAVGIRGCTNIRVLDVYPIDMAGDGFYVSGAADNTPAFSNNIWIYRCVSTNCMRNGTSIVSAKNLWMIDCANNGTNGKDPESGLDLETDGSIGFMDNVNIINMSNSDNKQADYSLVLGGNTTPSINDPDIKLINCVSRDSTTYVETIAFMILNHKDTYADNGSIQLIDCTAKNINNMGLFIRNIDRASTPVHIRNMTLIDTALTAASNIKDPGTDLVIGDSPFNMDVNNGTFFPNPGGVHIDGLKIRDNTRDRGPYFINSSFTVWEDVIIKNLDWVNSVGETTLPFSEAGADIVVEKIDQPFQLDRTANITLSTRFSGWECTNIGAGGAVVFTLPPIASSFESTNFTFIVKAGQVLRIDPDAADKIHNFGNGDGKFVEASSIGVTMKISFLDTDGWLLEVNDESALTAEA